MTTLNNVVLFVLSFVLVLSVGSVVPAFAQGTWYSPGPSVDDFTGETSYMALQNLDQLSIIILCDDENTTSVSFVLNGGKISRDGTLLYRLDGADIRTVQFTDQDAVISLAGARAIAFLMDIGRGLAMRVRIPTFRGSPAEGTFRILGMATHVNEIRKHCDW